VPTACRVAPCPAHVRARVWGGTVDGVTQRVGDARVPRVGDEVGVAFVARPSAPSADGRVEATVIR